MSDNGRTQDSGGARRPGPQQWVPPQIGPNGEQIFQFSGQINTVIQNVMEIFDPSPHKKRHFTKAALEHLQPVPLADLGPDETRCSICFEPFEEYVEPGSNDASSASNSSGMPIQHDPELPKMFEGFNEDDPPLTFPEDSTASTELQYTPMEEEVYKEEAVRRRRAGTAPIANTEDAHYAVRLPQCSHIFGRSCIAEWLKSNVSCPLCRREVVPEMSEEEPALRALIFYPVALTEVFVPIDWTGPHNSGYEVADPPVSFPAEGEGSAYGRRTGPPLDTPPEGTHATNNANQNDTSIAEDSEDEHESDHGMDHEADVTHNE